MSITQSKSNQKVCRPAQENEITSNLADGIASVKDGDLCRITWVDIEQALTEEWQVGGSAMTHNPIRV
jgi:hypothetical protein